MLKRILHFLLFLLLPGIYGHSQQQIQFTVSPKISKAIKGHKELDRRKYFNLAANVTELNKVLTEERKTYYMNDLEMTIGRRLGMVGSELRWGNSIREDASRSGYADTAYYKSKNNPNDNGLADYQTYLGSNQHVALHDRHNSYPDFMDLYGKEGTDQQLPGNTDAAAELAAIMLKYEYTDFQRPAFYEIVNEPHWRFNGDQRFYDLHTKVNNKVDELGLDVLVGGPCSSVSNYYKKEYDNLSVFTEFIDRTNFELDFYSFHSYDYMRWDGQDFTGAITSGLPLEGVIDGVAAHTYHTYGSEFKYVASEHGGYFTDGVVRDQLYDSLGNVHFPGSGFEFEMEKRTIDNFLMVNSVIANTMTYMNHPHIVLKAVPFILLESSGWDPYYYSSLLVKEDFQKSSPNWVQSRHIDLYRFFAGVQGRRVDFTINDTDIQSHAFVDGNRLILLFHNQSNTLGNMDINIRGLETQPGNITVRRLGRKADFRPSYSEEMISNLSDITIGAQESVAILATYSETIPEEESLNEDIFYADTWEKIFTGSHEFTVEMPGNEVKNATLRVGISREASKAKEVEISVNGTVVPTPVEDCAERITSDMYATTKIVTLDPALLKRFNKVKVTFPDGKSGGVGAVVVRAVLGKEKVILSIDSERENLKVYPNPSRNLLHFSGTMNAEAEIMDISGNVLKTFSIKSGHESISLNELSSGIYLLRIRTGDKAFTKRIVIKQ